MSNVNYIQSAILQLEGGAFQKLFDIYLYKKYKFKNIQTLGVHTGTNKPTKGTPDSYVLTDEGNYILINYGTVNSQPARKIKADILSCFDEAKLRISENRIKKIICGHCSTNIHMEDFDNIMESIQGVEIELIGIDTLSHDLALHYPYIAKAELGVSIDTNQFFDIEDFVTAYDANGINAPLDCNLLHRESEITEICDSIRNNRVTVLTGSSGIGKTRLAIEACRRENDGITEVYCVKSNGNFLYEDIKFYISNPGSYLIFFDDANMVISLDNIFNTILTLPTDFDVRLLISVREYAKHSVLKAVSKYSEANIIEIGQFKNDEIKDILESNLGIKNPQYLKKIAEIANGNIRLALLAGIRSREDGYQAIRNAEDIFKNYYGRIIDEAKLTKEDILMLFFIAVSGPVKNKDNQLYSDLKESYGADFDDDDIISKLYSLELIDWFKNEITQIADQSLGNYILYHVLFEKKWISVKELISIAFPRYRNKAVYALNTLMEIFYSEECNKYIKDSIIAAWDNAPEGQNTEYLESFYLVNPYKALSIINNRIRLGVVVDFDLRNYDINSKKNHHNIKTREIEILAGFKYTDSYEDAIDLLMRYFEKRPDLIMDFYFALSGKLLYDKESYHYGYKYEALLLNKLWHYSEEGRNYNNSVLYLHIVESALKTARSFEEKNKDSRSVNLIKMSIKFTEEMANLRTRIWKNIATLRKNEDYHHTTNRILLGMQYNCLNEEESRKYLHSDFNTIYKYVIDQRKPDFFDARIISNYRSLARRIGIKKIDQRFMIGENNSEFKVCKLLTCEHSIGRTLAEDEKFHKETISKEIRAYDLVNFHELFRICSFLEEVTDSKDQWALKKGMDCVFEIIEEERENLYLKILEGYFKANTPFSDMCGYRQIKYMLSHFGYEVTYDFVNKHVFDNKNILLSLIWEILPEKNIDESAATHYKTFILNNLANNNCLVSTFETIARYAERDSELKADVIKAIGDNLELFAGFFDYAYHNEDDIEDLISFFRDDIVLLAHIYINALSTGNLIDFDGKLFIKIYNQDPAIWYGYVDWVKTKGNIGDNGNEHEIFELIWDVDKWRECVDYAFKTLIENDEYYYLKDIAGLLFTKARDMAILERKKAWLTEKLRENISEIERCKPLINIVVNALPDWKLEYILEFLKANNKFEDFKKISLFSLSYSWSGSEIPIIMEKINFLKLLKDNLSGANYIDHKKYIEEYRIELEKYKEKVELREYLENSDFA
ncbi:hypothetical protein [Abiotrophia sp. HMSC24B09]|uniref:hypothetical protein n=1 Tax=Abiotrophia sp. HMSC24B09 TaxID=1581061 RepID=UPI0008A1F9E9|nr:hypothetical protein [Abiotrophia sp. HMSC24B09]OFS30274.1 hypothetical protein HMPREF3093_01100 [Abiotrophia sp. HMSC24B09]